MTSVDRVAVVCDAARADSAIPRTEDRLVDVGVTDPTKVITRTDDHVGADVAVPTFETGIPAATDGDARAAVADVIESTVGVEIERNDEETLSSRVPRLEPVVDVASRVRERIDGSRR